MSGMNVGAGELAKLAEIFPWMKVRAVKALTEECKTRQAELESDQNDYLIEMEDFDEDTQVALETIQEEIEKLQARMAELQQKANDGTITEDEKDEYQSIANKLVALQSYMDKEVQERQDEAVEKGEKFAYVVESEGVANKTIEMGKPLAETEVSNSFFSRIFGKARRQQNRKDVGQAAVEAGTNLLRTVTDILANVWSNVLNTIMSAFSGNVTDPGELPPPKDENPPEKLEEPAEGESEKSPGGPNKIQIKDSVVNININ